LASNMLFQCEYGLMSGRLRYMKGIHNDD